MSLPPDVSPDVSRDWLEKWAKGPLLHRFFAVSVRFFLYFRIRQPVAVAVAVRPKIAKKPDRTGP